MKTIASARHVLTVKNKINRLYPDGLLIEGTEVRCLRQNSFGIYAPCVAYVVGVTITGKVRVDLWKDRSERVIVTRDAILWPTETCLHFHTNGYGKYTCELAKGHGGPHSASGCSWTGTYAHAMDDRLAAKVAAMPEGERPTAKLLLKRVDELLQKHPEGIELTEDGD